MSAFVSRCGRIVPLLLILLLPALSLGQTFEDGGQIEFPDGSVDQGGADRDQPENRDSTGRVTIACSTSIECQAGFVCEDRQCRWRGIRKAEGGFGCGGMAATAVLLPLVAGAWVRRRGRR